MDIMLTGEDQSQAYQPNSLAKVGTVEQSRSQATWLRSNPIVTLPGATGLSSIKFTTIKDIIIMCPKSCVSHLHLQQDVFNYSLGRTSVVPATEWPCIGKTIKLAQTSVSSTMR
eukprot:1159980-Pelagomonas_calceolata.AAC.1